MKKLILPFFVLSLLLTACSETVVEQSVVPTEKVTATSASTTTEKGYLETKTLPYINQQLEFYEQIWFNNWSKVWVGYASSTDAGDNILPKMDVGIQRYEDFVKNLKEVPIDGLSDATKAKIGLAIESYSTAALIRVEAMQYSKEQLTNGKSFSFTSLSTKVDEMIIESDKYLLFGSNFLVDVSNEFDIPVK